MEKLVFVGTGAERDPNNPHKWLGDGNRIHVLSFDAEGCLSTVEELCPLDGDINPMCLDSLTARDGSIFVYSVSGGEPLAHVVCHKIERRPVGTTSAPQFSAERIGTASSGGQGACFLQVVPANAAHNLSHACVLVANYGEEKGAVAVLPIGDDGKPQAPSCIVEHDPEAASTPGTGRQDTSHPHMISYREGYAYVPDLGQDRIVKYQLTEPSPMKFGLTEVHSIELPKESGPRHIAFLSSDAAVVVNELNNTVLLVKNDEVVGSAVSTLPANWAGWDDSRGKKPFDFYTAPSHAAGIAVNGNNVFVTNRGHDSVAILEVDGDSIRLIRCVPSGGRLPWSVQVKR